MKKLNFKQILAMIGLGSIVVSGSLSVIACDNKKVVDDTNKKDIEDFDDNDVVDKDVEEIDDVEDIDDIDADNPDDNNQWKPLINKWNKVNPNRNKSVTNRAARSSNYIFQPYYDGGLYSGTTVRDIIEGKNMTLKNGETVFNKVNNFDSITLSFVQQAVGVSDRLQLTVAGQSFGEGYNWWVENKFKPEVLNPLVQNQTFKNIVVAYGGAASAVGYNPWDIAYKLANKNINKAVDLLIPAFIEYQKRITKFAGLDPNKDMPLNLDLDIEGIPFDQEHIAGMKVLFTALAKMKLDNPNWNFTITLPVLRTGLVSRDIDNVLKPALLIFKQHGLTKKNNLFNINIMTMDYGEATGNDVIKEGITFFKAATDATENTGKQYKTLIKEIWGIDLSEQDINRKLIATPMIGINDVNNNYFTLEDAKDLYNWAQVKNLAGLRMWSLNRDDSGKTNEAWSVTNHGLKYLNLWDFTHAFTGDWTNWVKNPVHSAK
ncbi:hypothetical protein [Spiroplasma platyhelix]|uniref:Chitinase n=1 Tax=Spiroplasma platyhelix PALS-1 TaxID=1276218 RepID=A0A846U146_9MOLU|nr:hypothetical protein [Spiroplasma platyhelix]MBE4703856.1 hypothetical protein [Spiroplasma platyhelix PALS-1]NKE38229.1 hypothetical protein [Spiroplasma platyhelix PALS-1]UJB29114.1 bifunctional chitinase/lysozyme [Spiroplasma platyhelix PALS-1]